MNFLIAGAGGLVGRALANHLRTSGEQFTALDHHALDISDEASVRSACAAVRPDAIINCAAWTDVDGCESDSAHAQRANARGPELLAQASRDHNALLVTISTDYVFDGTKDGFYTQRDQPNPISVYGQSKLDGERRAQIAWARTIVVRSGYIFGAGGRNFLSTIVARARRGERLKGIRDMVGTPTYAPHLAQRLYRLAHMDLPGIYHVVNSGEGVSFLGFATAALEHAGLDAGLLESTTLSELNRPAPRPGNSRLRCLFSDALGLPVLPDWQDALAEFIEAEASQDVAGAGGGNA